MGARETPTRRLLSTCALACLVAPHWDVVTRALPSVTAVLETRPSFGDDAGGNADADDPHLGRSEGRLKLKGKKVDLAVASDRYNDTIRIFQGDRAER